MTEAQKKRMEELAVEYTDKIPLEASDEREAFIFRTNMKHGYTSGYKAAMKEAEALASVMEAFCRKFSPGDDWFPEMRDALKKWRGE